MSTENTRYDAGGGDKDDVDEAADVDMHELLELSGIFSRLVLDIFLNIMSRVPLKSLSQCRWVCKSWYKLVKSPSFAKIQYDWAIKNNAPWALYWNSLKELYLVDDQAFYNLETSATPHSLALEFPKYFHIAGYANGLLCVASDPAFCHPSPICICNPVTGEHIALKSPMYEMPAIVAFGFDPTTNDYKVIRFINYVDEDGKDLSSEGEVYTLGSSEWRKIDVPYIMDDQRCGVLLNGNLHWITYVHNSPIINVFNVGSEKFDVMQFPNRMRCNRKRLVVIEGNLCFLNKEFLNPCKPYEIWEMKEYGVHNSWVKKYSFYSDVESWLMYGSHDLIKLRNGEFLLQFGGYEKKALGYLDPGKDTLRPVEIMMLKEKPDFDEEEPDSDEEEDFGDYFQSVVQVGSLFSPKDADKSRSYEWSCLFQSVIYAVPERALRVVLSFV